jgi:hypothetical protein
MVNRNFSSPIGVWISAVFLFGAFSAAEVAGETTADEVVKAFYSADFNGARLTPEKYKAVIRPLIVWEHEPGWDTVFVTKRAYVSKSESNEDGKATVEVRYDVLGIWSSDEPLTLLGFKEVVDFMVIRTKQGWKIKGPVFYPHVSPEALSRHLERTLEAGAFDEQRVKRYKRQIELLLEMK